MTEKIKFAYTDSAHDLMAKEMDKYKEQIESVIKDRKYIPGDKFIEITASDVELASQRIIRKSFLGYSPRMEIIKSLTLDLYLYFGFAVLIYGIFYDYFHDMSSTQKLYIISGIIFIIFNRIIYRLLLQRDNKIRFVRNHDISSYEDDDLRLR
jgi:hypothetical protein